jgi:hypothetical protein
MNKEIPVVQGVSQEALFEKLSNSIPAEMPISVSLPSRGVGYKSAPTGVVELRPMTFEDEKMLSTSKGKGQDILNLLLSNCAPKLNIDELYSFDKLFLILKLREISYGPDYVTAITCPACSIETNLTISIDKIGVIEVPTEFTPVVEVKLKKTPCTILAKLPNSATEQYLDTESTLADNLWRFVVAIRMGEEELTDKRLISSILDKLPLVDKKLVIKGLNPEYGVQTKVKFICEECKGSKIIELPITSDFFTVS